MHDMNISDGKDPQHSHEHIHSHANTPKYHPDHGKESPSSSMHVILSAEILSAGSLFNTSKTDLFVFTHS